MRGAPLRIQKTFENQVQPDPIRARCVRPADVLHLRFAANPTLSAPPFYRIVFSGFPGSFLTGQTDPIYQARVCIRFNLRIALNGTVIFDGPLHNRSHPGCDPLQRTALKFPAVEFPLRRGWNRLTVENRTRPAIYPGITDYHLASVAVEETDGRRVSRMKLTKPVAVSGQI